MSSELYDKFARINRIDQAIQESELEMKNGGDSIEVDESFNKLDEKYYGQIFFHRRTRKEVLGGMQAVDVVN